MTRILYTGLLLVALMGALSMTGVACGSGVDAPSEAGAVDGPVDGGGGNVVENPFPPPDAEGSDAAVSDGGIDDGAVGDGAS